MQDRAFEEMIEYYREQGVPQDQQMLVALLREAQQAEGGALTRCMLEEIARAYGLKSTLLLAIIRRVPDLRMENVPHRLEICGACPKGAALRAEIERTYAIKSGASSEAAGFSYRVTPCMKNCKNGPSVKWDGQLYSGMTVEALKALIQSAQI